MNLLGWYVAAVGMTTSHHGHMAVKTNKHSVWEETGRHHRHRSVRDHCQSHHITHTSATRLMSLLWLISSHETHALPISSRLRQELCMRPCTQAVLIKVDSLTDKAASATHQGRFFYDEVRIVMDYHHDSGRLNDPDIASRTNEKRAW